MITTFAELFEQLKGKGKTRVIVAGGEDLDALQAVEQSYKLGFGEAVLIGNRQKIDQALASFSDTNFVKEILKAGSEEEKARIAVETVKQGGVLLKGTTKTAILMKAALNKEWGLRSGEIMTSLTCRKPSTPQFSRR
jgi:phosphate butyryltransferase